MKKFKLYRCRLLLSNKKYIAWGKNSTFGRGTVFWAPNQLSVGDNVYIGKYCTIQADIEIGNNVVIGNNVGLIGKYDHDYSKVGMNIKDAPWIGDQDYRFKGKGQKLVIEEDVWIGFGSVIFTGIHIGRGSIIAAGSIVTHDVPPYSIVVGNPARVKSYRFNEAEIAQHERLLYQ
jgi:acetyltransferase-like isoleucine patch superfamily enzyme